MSPDTVLHPISSRLALFVHICVKIMPSLINAYLRPCSTEETIQTLSTESQLLHHNGKNSRDARSQRRMCVAVAQLAQRLIIIFVYCQGFL